MREAAYNYDAVAAIRYDAAVPVQSGEVEFYLELAQQARARGLPAIEVACGTGRIAIPLARKGIQITGIDNSPSMLDRAREKSAGLDNVAWFEADMRDFDLSERFGLASIPAGSFQLLLTTEDQMSCLRSIHRHLAPGGRLALALGNPNIVVMGEWLTSKRGTYVRNPARDFRHPETGLAVKSWASQELHPSEQIQIGHGFTEELDAGGIVVRRVYGQSMRLRYLHRFETEHLLARCGFEVDALYGDLRKSPFRGGSPAMVWVASRAE